MRAFVSKRPDAGLAEQRATILARFFSAPVGPCRHCGQETVSFLWLWWTHRVGGIWCGLGGHRASPTVGSACVRIGEQFVFVEVCDGAIRVNVDVEANPTLFPGGCVPIVFEVGGQPVASFDAAGAFTAHA